MIYISSNNINWLGNKVVDPTLIKPLAMEQLNQSVQINPKTESKEYTEPTTSQQTPAPPYTYQPVMPMQPVQPVQPAPLPPENQQGPPPAASPGFVPAYLARNLGKNMRCEFIINNFSLDKTGRLIEVGVNYFILEDASSRSNIMCDLYSVKFVTVTI